LTRKKKLWGPPSFQKRRAMLIAGKKKLLGEGSRSPCVSVSLGAVKRELSERARDRKERRRRRKFLLNGALEEGSEAVPGEKC